MKTVSSTEAKARLNALLAEVERTGSSVTITTHGRPVAVLIPVQARPRTFGQLPGLVVAEGFDDPLPESEIAAWEGNPGANWPEAGDPVSDDPSRHPHAALAGECAR